jgi:hypothetical protein
MVTHGGWSEKLSEHETNCEPASLKHTLRTGPLWLYVTRSIPVSISHKMTFWSDPAVMRKTESLERETGRRAVASEREDCKKEARAKPKVSPRRVEVPDGAEVPVVGAHALARSSNPQSRDRVFSLHAQWGVIWFENDERICRLDCARFSYVEPRLSYPPQ